MTKQTITKDLAPKKATIDLIKNYGNNDKDSGSTSVQVAILTQKIQYLTEHLKQHKKDHHSRYGLIKMVNKRRKLLRYLSRKKPSDYDALLKRLQLRR